MKFNEFTLDPFQEEAIQAIENNESVVVSAPTGSGKTLIADYIIHKHRNDNQRIIYTAPIKALSNQKYKDFSKDYGEQMVGLMTGDFVINPHAKVLIMTTEIYRNMAISGDEEVKNISYVIFDEIHYINDIERGYVWEESVIYSSLNVRFLCLSATIPNAEEFSRWISAIKKHTVRTVTSTERHVPLEHWFYDYELGITSAEKIKKAMEIPHYDQVMGKRKKRKWERVPEPNHIELIKSLGLEKLPCFFFTFSRRDCQNKAKELARQNFFPKERPALEFFLHKVHQAPSDVHKLTSVNILKETLTQGIAFHHAGLLPVVKETIEELFAQGLIRVLYTTETFAVGINMPAKTVCFNALRKYDGLNFRPLNTKEYFQIAGRAGRRGIDDKGYVVSMIFRPTFNYHEVKRITSKDIEPIRSQFRLSVNTVLNLIEQHSPEEIEKILRLSFYSYQKFGEKFDKIPSTVLLSRYSSIVRKLKKFGYLEQQHLTPKGIFSSRIFADELTIGEIFATSMVDQLNEYPILLTLAVLVYEPRETYKFKQKFPDDALHKLKGILHRNEYLSREKKFLELETMTSIIHPMYHGKNFFQVLENTNLLEGDLIRLYAQILDRLGQIRKASTNYKLLAKIANCEGIIRKVLEGIYEI
ncbi:DEAD/DEAH box helicase [Candidatus Woesearchaeota archaeon]|nr:DEAD/DEAH box helicase [Candidatus Woesearchaeota archaeon]